MLARVRPLARGSLARPFATTAKPPPAPVLPVDFDASPAKGPWYMNLKPPLRLHPTKLLWSASKGKTDSKAPLPALPLAPKHMLDSFISVQLPFRTDKPLHDEYVNSVGSIRLGRLLEDMDAFAGAISYRHVDDYDATTRPPTNVTASVDRIVLLSSLKGDRNMQLRGHVSFVGSSSMDVHVVVEREVLEGDSEFSAALPKGSGSRWTPLIMADFVMASRDPDTGKAFPIQKLELTTDVERAIYQRGLELSQRRKEQRLRSLKSSTPTAAESKIIHDIYHELKSVQVLGAANRPANILFARETRISSMRMCFPQERNVHGKLFGGHLMREAYELAYTLACMYSKTTPKFMCQDEVQFHKPVEIGSILSYDAQIVLAMGHPHKSFHVAVTADVISPGKGGARETTTVFSFTFAVNNPNAPPLRRVLPETYDESIQLIEALRRKDEGKAFATSLREDPVPWVLQAV